MLAEKLQIIGLLRVSTSDNRVTCPLHATLVSKCGRRQELISWHVEQMASWQVGSDANYPLPVTAFVDIRTTVSLTIQSYPLPVLMIIAVQNIIFVP